MEHVASSPLPDVLCFVTVRGVGYESARVVPRAGLGSFTPKTITMHVHDARRRAKI